MRTRERAPENPVNLVNPVKKNSPLLALRQRRTCIRRHAVRLVAANQYTDQEKRADGDAAKRSKRTKASRAMRERSASTPSEAASPHMEKTTGKTVSQCFICLSKYYTISRGAFAATETGARRHAVRMGDKLP